MKQLYSITKRMSSYLRDTTLERYDVPQILDFTHACRVIFGPGGDVAFVASGILEMP
jgi:hypothetical protein